MINTLYTGDDNLHLLHRLDSNSVDLIYLDPPFNSKHTYSAPIGSKAAGSSFKDMWSWNDAKHLSSRSRNLNFEEMSIPIGATLTAVVTDDVAKVIGPKELPLEVKKCH